MNVVAPTIEAETVTPLKLRSLSAEAASLQSELARVFQPLNVTAGGAQILAGLDAPRQPQADVPWVHFTIDGAAGAVQVPWGVLRRITGLVVEGAASEDTALVLEDALSEALDQIETAIGVTLRLQRVSDAAEALPVATTLNLQGKDASGSFVQMRQPMALSVDAARVFSQALEQRQVLREDLPGLVLKLAWETQAGTLSAKDLNSLEIGDAIELNGDVAAGQLVLQGQYTAEAIRDENRFTLRTAFSLMEDGKENQMSEDVALEKQIETDINDVEVRLSFRAGQTSLPLKTLRGLAPGAVLEMTDPANAEVEILANGRVVGAGELIEVAGRRAVQIRRLFTGV